MKKILLIFLTIVLLVSPCFAGSVQDKCKAVIAKKNSGGVTNGTIGSLTGGTSVAYSSARIAHSKTTPTIAGTVRYGHAYVNDSNGWPIYIKLTNSTGTVLLCCTVTPDDGVAGWANCDAGDTEVLGAATTYYVGVMAIGGSADFDKLVEGSSGIWYDGTEGDCTDTEIDEETTLSDADGFIRVYWNNVAGNPE